MPTQAERLQALENEVAQLRYDMGPSGDFERDGYLDNPVRIRLHEIGVAIDYCVDLCSQMKTRMDSIDTNDIPSVPVPPPVSTQVPASTRTELESMGFDFAPNGELSGFRLITQGAPEGDYYGYVGVNDGALRLFAGIRKKLGLPWPNVDVNRNLPVIMGPVTERDGAISWDFDPPLRAEDPNPRPFKTFLIYLAGFVRGVGPRSASNVGRFIDFCTFEKGRGIRWSTRRAGSTTPDIDTALQLDAENANAVAVRVGGQLRRLTIDGSGKPAFGEVVEEDT